MRRSLLLVPAAVLTAGALLAEAMPAYAAAVVARDDEVATSQGRARTVDVLGNDEGSDLRVVGTWGAEHGVVSIDDDGRVTYRPDDDFVGEDSFDYRARDDDGDDGRATVRVTVAEPARVDPPAPWTVLRPASITGSGPPGATLTIRVTGPQTDRTVSATASADGSWATEFTPTWQGPHEVAVAVTAPDTADLVRVAATARARYLTSSSAVTGASLGRSYRPGCPVGPASLRALSVTYWDWAGRVRTGRVVAHRRAIADLRYVFRVAFRTRFPFRSVTPVDEFYRRGRTPTQSDLRSMRADNTSAYNCRQVTGNRHRRSPHSYGISIDINPRENPYVTSRRIYPRGARRYLDRGDVRKGMLLRSSPVVRAFVRRGWRWGAYWGHPDYQHFDM